MFWLCECESERSEGGDKWRARVCCASNRPWHARLTTMSSAHTRRTAGAQLVDELEKVACDIERVRDLCNRLGGVPSALRPQVWKVTLSVS